MKILIADDEPDIRKLISIYCKAKGIEADIVEDGAYALRNWSNRHYDLIILDGEMPLMNGYTTIKQMRIADKVTPIILFTGAEGENIKLFCKTHNVTYCHKNLNVINNLEQILMTKTYNANHNL